MANFTLLTVLFLFCVFKSAAGRDYVLEAFNRQVDHSSDPCDNFYRHVCPISKKKKLTLITDEDVRDLLSETLKLSFFETTIKADLRNLAEHQGNLYRNPENFNGEIHKAILANFESLCLSNQNTSIFLSTVTEFLLPREPNLKDLSEDRNCSKSVLILDRILEYDHLSDVFSMEQRYWGHEQGTAISLMYADDKIIGAAYEIQRYLKQMHVVVKDWAEKTPWLVNSGTLDSFQRIIEKVHVYISASDFLRKSLENFIEIDRNYLKCKNGLRMNNEAEIIICASPALKSHPIIESLEFDAFNVHPLTFFSYPAMYWLVQLKDEASKLGLVGTILAHEFGHSIIENYRVYDNFIPYFSENVRTCIQQQFNSTCEEFSEIEQCIPYKWNVDENGADLIGNQLAYELLKNTYGDELHTKHPQINATYEQLFFYARSLIHCNGELVDYNQFDQHSPSNIRGNVIVQLPEFQTAFNCSDDSRMMRSRSEHCIILGEGAPQTRRR